jgi:hypothetical protein
MHNGKHYVADIALCQSDGNPKYIIEVNHTHKTDIDTRPDPWFEVDTKDMDKYIEQDKNIIIDCKREDV